MTLTLRDYQEECVEAHYRFFRANKTGHPLFVVPTAGGKSLIISEFIKRTITKWPEVRILVVTHVKELIEQNYNEFVNHWGGIVGCPAGIYSAGLGRRNTTSQVLFAGIQSIYNRAGELGMFHLVLVDECHLIPKTGQGRYRKYLADLAEIHPSVRVCGYTATHFRTGGGYLHKGDGRILTDIAYNVQVEPLIEAGYLSNLVAKLPEHVIDTTGVRTVNGEFDKRELEDASIQGDAVKNAVRETVEIARKDDRKHWLFFATGIEHAGMIVVELARNGVHDVATIFGDTPKDERAETIARFRAGKLTALVNVGVLTTGFNAPCTDLLAVMRATQSTALYVQIMGRGMRTAPGKRNCLVLDYGRNVERHGPINDVRPRDKGEAPPPTKVCEECQTIVLIAIKECPECGYVFPVSDEPPDRKHKVSASSDAIVDFEKNKPKVLGIRHAGYSRHKKPGKPDSMRATYFTQTLATLSEWVCFEHPGFARRKAIEWWRSRGGALPTPETVGEALDRVGEVTDPVQIHVRKDGNGYQVITKAVMPSKEGTT